MFNYKENPSTQKYPRARSDVAARSRHCRETRQSHANPVQAAVIRGDSSLIDRIIRRAGLPAAGDKIAGFFRRALPLAHRVRNNTHRYTVRPAGQTVAARQPDIPMTGYESRQTDPGMP